MRGFYDLKNYNMINLVPSFLLLALCILFWLWQNTRMPRWVPILITAILGITLGLIYGWAINPVQYSDITPAALRIDYRTDYVLMVAEANQADQNSELAARRLALLGSEPPAIIVDQAYIYAQQSAYSVDDLSIIQELGVAMQAWDVNSGPNTP